jgi:hypothetical protein
MISFLFLIYALKTWGKFDVFGGGPLSLILSSGGRKTQQEEKEKDREGEAEGGQSGILPSATDGRSLRDEEEEEDEEERTEGARSALVSSWSGGEEDSDESEEVNKDMEGEKREEGRCRQRRQVTQEGKHPPGDREIESSDEDSDSNITSELSDDHTFDDSICEDETNDEQVNIELDRDERRVPDEKGGANGKAECGGGRECESNLESDYISDTPWYTEYLAGRADR